MVFLRDTGSSTGSERFPSGFSPPKGNKLAHVSPARGGVEGRGNGKGKERAVDVETGELDYKSRSLGHLEPSDSLLHRLAGPSTGKAGLKRDPNEVRKVIYESSKGGHYFKNEERKDEELTAQIRASLRALDNELATRMGDLSNEERKADKVLAEQECKRDLTQCIVVVDCDAFYASVEELDDPSLKGKAFGVGEGVLTTASYEARKYGCRSAMPGYIAKKLCPHLIFVKPDFSKYSAASSKVMAVIARYDPNYSPASLDEAYMNLTPYLARTGMTAADAIGQMREEVKRETGLTVSAGSGPNTMLAKIAADVNKPDGQCVVEPNAEACRSFMEDLSVRKIPGIGRVTERWLEALGVVLCRDIYTLRGRLILAKGETGATWLLRSYLGIAGNVVEKGKREDRRGVGHETTFSTIWRSQDFDSKLREIADSLGGDLAKLKYSGRTLTLKLKLETYEVLSRSKTIEGVTFANADQLYKHGKLMLDAEVAKRATAYDAGQAIKGKGRELRLRLMGLKVSHLKDESDEAAVSQKKGGLHKWAVKQEAPKLGDNKHQAPIDLTQLQDSENEAEEDDFEEIFLEAAPCPKCHKTVPFADDVFTKHIADCAIDKSKIIDLSLLSSQDLDPLRPGQPDHVRRQGHSRQSRRRNLDNGKASRCPPAVASSSYTGKSQRNAFSSMMKEASAATQLKRKRK